VTANINFSMIQAIIPEICLVILGIVVMVIDLVLPVANRKVLGWVSAVGLFLAMLISLFIGRPGTESTLLWGGMIRFDWFGFVFSMIFLFGAGITSLLTTSYGDVGKKGEYYLLLLASTLGMCLMASSGDIIMLYLAIETTSIPMYVLAGFLTNDKKSTESGFKYLLFGAMTSAIMLYGFSLIYGLTGTTSLYQLAERFWMGGITIPAIGALILILVGFGFKISVVPFHFWAPDVYEGAPTPIAGFLSTASKAAGFAVLIRVLVTAFPQYVVVWSLLLAGLAIATMTLGNLLALTQREGNIKRLLAYSSIAHAGYILIGVVVATQAGVSSVIYYLLVYLLTNLAVFGVVTAVSGFIGSDEIKDYAGLSRRNPGMALVLLVGLLSLAGMPPLGGFIIKFLIFASAVQANMIWLAVIAVINSIIGLYYYLYVLKVVYLYQPQDETPLPIPGSYSIVLGFLSLAIILLGTIFTPWINIAVNAALNLFKF
jgi:NADH-quinone oxidoreductase subunit N